MILRLLTFLVKDVKVFLVKVVINPEVAYFLV